MNRCGDLLGFSGYLSYIQGITHIQVVCTVKIEEPLLKIELGSPEGGALTHCHQTGGSLLYMHKRKNQLLLPQKQLNQWEAVPVNSPKQPSQLPPEKQAPRLWSPDLCMVCHHLLVLNRNSSADAKKTQNLLAK